LCFEQVAQCVVVTLIGTREPVEDEDVPLPRSVTVEWVEGLGDSAAHGIPTLRFGSRQRDAEQPQSPRSVLKTKDFIPNGPG